LCSWIGKKGDLESGSWRESVRPLWDLSKAKSNDEILATNENLTSRQPRYLDDDRAYDKIIRNRIIEKSLVYTLFSKFVIAEGLIVDLLGMEVDL